MKWIHVAQIFIQINIHIIHISKVNEDISSKLCTNINALTTRSLQSPNISNDAELERAVPYKHSNILEYSPTV